MSTNLHSKGCPEFNLLGFGRKAEFLAQCLAHGLPHSVRPRSGHLRNERRRIELQPSPIVGADVASLVDRRDGAADRLPRVGDAVRLGDDVHQSCELEDPSKKASWARGVAGRIKTAGGGLTSHLAPPGPFSSVFMETKTRTTTGRLSVRPAQSGQPAPGADIQPVDLRPQTAMDAVSRMSWEEEPTEMP